MWSFDTGKACYDGSESVDSLVQPSVFTIGESYTVNLTISGITQGKLILESLSGKPDFTEDGEYVVTGMALQETIELRPDYYLSEMFIGCVDDIKVQLTPLYRIEDGEGNIVYEQPANESVQAYGEILQYGVNWEDIPFGTYKIKFTDGPLIYASHCLCVGEYPCSILLTWTNDENAGGFNYSDLDFTQSLRVEGNIGQDFGKSIQNDVFRFSDGSKQVLYTEVDQMQILTIKEMPRYLHRALMLGIKYDHFQINGVEHIVDQDDYQPAWRPSSNLAPVTLTVTPSNEGFINQNCS